MVNELLSYAIDLALKMGANYAEARYHELRSDMVVMKEENVMGVGGEISRGIAIRVLLDGIVSFSSTASMTREGVKDAVEKAIARARVLAEKGLNKGLPRELAPARIGRAKYSVVVSKPYDALTIDSKIGILREAVKHTREALREAKLASLTIEYQETVENKIVITSDGGYVESSIPRIIIGYNIVLAHPQKGTIQRFCFLGSASGLEALDEWKLSESIPAEASRLENVLVHGVEPPKGKLPVVLGSEVVGLVVHESCGHPMEADRVWGRESAQAGESFVKERRIGDTIGNEHATVIDDPTIPKSFGFYLYDDECVAARPRYLYYRGVINEMLHNRWSAAVYGVESNGAARACNFLSEPIPRMSNTYLEPGDYTFEELLEGIKEGLYIKNYMEWNIDDYRWGQRYIGLEAYIIRNGELAEPVRNPVLEFTTEKFYKSIEAKGKELRFYAAFCGKGEPMQAIPAWMGGPDVRLKNLVVR